MFKKKKSSRIQCKILQAKPNHFNRNLGNRSEILLAFTAWFKNDFCVNTVLNALLHY